MPKKTKSKRVFYLGTTTDFYFKSGTQMSNYYAVGTKERLSLGDIESFLLNGFNVIMRPATKAEMFWAYRELDRITSR